MNTRRASVAGGVLGGLLLVTVACTSGGGGRDASTAASPSTPSGPAAPSRVVSAATATDLAPAGPAPGGVVDEGEGNETPAASAIAKSIGCQDGEGQQHLPVVSEQLSCRRGTERVYILTFTSSHHRDTYLDPGPQVVPGGFNVVGSTWVVHVVSADTANALAQQLHGSVSPGA